MECIKCKSTMFQARLNGHHFSVYLVNKKPGFLGAEKRGDVSCFVCPECGYIELNAVDPKALQFSE